MSEQITILGLLAQGARPLFRLMVIMGLISALGYMGWQAVLRSPYFHIRNINTEATSHLTREQIIERVGLNKPVNTFLFDVEAAEDALMAHPWVARADIKTVLPDSIEIEVQERSISGVVVLDALYLVDGSGQPFARPKPDEASGLHLVTGLTRESYEKAPGRSESRIRDALSVARLYEQSEMAQQRPLSDVYLAPSGRTELLLGHTRVVLGREHFRKKLQRLEAIFAQLKVRKRDASYILISEDEHRAIVKETPLQEALRGSLTLRR